MNELREKEASTPLLLLERRSIPRTDNCELFQTQSAVDHRHKHEPGYTVCLPYEESVSLQLEISSGSR